MKKLLLTTLIAAILILPLGTVALADEEPIEAPASDYVEYLPGHVPAQSSSAESMAPALHAVLLAMGNQGVTSIDAENMDLAWEMLYNMLSMYGQMDERSFYEGEVLVLPSETVYDYSAALFNDVLSPATLPEALADRMTYDANTDEFRLVCGNADLSEVVISSTVDQGGTIQVTGCLMYVAEETELASFDATLALSDNMFGCTIETLNVA